MTLTESVAKLATLIPVLKASDAKFASDLIASFKKYGGLTPKQEPWIGKLIARAEAPVVAAPAAVNVGGFAGVVALFTTAKAHLKFPKIRLVLNGTKIVLSLNGAKSKFPGYISISGEGVYPNRAFYGKVSPEGVFTPFKSELPGLTALLSELASNPARVAKDHGKLTGNCCFCNKGIGHGKEERSALVGFGPDCAENYGLKAEWLAAVAKAEAKASVVSTEAPVPSIEVLTPEMTDVATAKLNADAFLSAQQVTASLVNWTTDTTKVKLVSDSYTGTEASEVLNTTPIGWEKVETGKCSACESTQNLFAKDGVVLCEDCEDNAAWKAGNEKFDAAVAKKETYWDTLTGLQVSGPDADQAKNDDDKAQDAANHDALQAELGPEYGVTEFPGLTPEVLAKAKALNAKAFEPQMVVCYFCEEPTLQYASLHGYIVCPTCVAQLK